MGKRATNGGPSWDAEVTAQTLERAALELLQRDGVLGGLNLREVADQAGVNRGLVYHYFGSRRDLLRSALRRNVRERVFAMRIHNRPMRTGARIREAVKSGIRYASSIRLAALLVLDGDKRLRVMPDLERTQEQFRREQDAGLIGQDVDLVALHAMLHSLVAGYVLSRSHLAKEFGVGVRELDERFIVLAERCCGAADGPLADVPHD
ncbi:helix-turn-helix domain-containing protein [Streptomyces solisilvae]|uniref:TetR/AcrR family transcriptional regulator n=1 Tax=Streptomyces malaysiensis TaxID=92644 RepID=UPI003330DA92